MKRLIGLFAACVLLSACGGFYAKNPANDKSPLAGRSNSGIAIKVTMFNDATFIAVRDDDLGRIVRNSFRNTISAAFERRGYRVVADGEIILEVKLYYFEKFHPFFPKRLQVHATLQVDGRTEFEREEAGGGLITSPAAVAEKAARLLFLALMN